MKKSIITVLLPCIALFFLVGCYPAFSITVYPENLPDNTEIHMLLKLDDPAFRDANDEFFYTDDPYISGTDEDKEAVKKSEIYNYSENGWKCADIFLSIVCDNSSDQPFRLDFTRSERSDFADKYKTFKIAVCSNDGDILKLSNEIPMKAKGKCAFYTEYNYDYESNNLKQSNGLKYFIDENGLTPDSSIWLFVIVTITCCLLFLVLLVVMLVTWFNRANQRRIGFVIAGGLLLIPYLATIVYSSILKYVPYYDISGKSLSSKISATLIESIALILLVSLFALLYFKKPRLPKSGTDAAAPITAGKIIAIALESVLVIAAVLFLIDIIT